MEGMKGAASGVVGDLARARVALDERGQKLGELEERTAAMMSSAESFSKHAHDVWQNLHFTAFFFISAMQYIFNSYFLFYFFQFSPQMMVKYKDKKWYQLWWKRVERWTLIMHTSISGEPGFLLLLFLSTGGCSALQNHALSLSTISSLSMTPFSRDEKQTVQLLPLLLLHFTWERRKASHPHMLLFTPRRKDKFCKKKQCSRGDLVALFFSSFLSKPFIVSAKHRELKWGEKSDPSHTNQDCERKWFHRNDGEGFLFVFLFWITNFCYVFLHVEGGL